jgi:GAF domain-containing protein
MSGERWLDWAILAVSLFNTMLVLWLGLTVLLNADRRHRGVWLMGAGLFFGAAFLISHSAIVGQPSGMNMMVLNLWWRAGWVAVILAPFAWYLAVLWYGGFWGGPVNTLTHRHRGWLWLMTLGLVGLMGWMLAANPIPAYNQLAPLNLRETLTVPPLPRLFLLFPLWMVACILLSIDALSTPAPAKDPNIALARQHARPWLLGTAGALLSVGLVVIYVVGSIIVTTATDRSFTIHMRTVATYDLALLLLLAIASLSLGQAIVSYEIFTGRMLPRRSLLQHWRIAIILAGGYAAIAAWSMVATLRPIDSLLLAIVPVALFHALYSWRSLREHEHFVARLRPFLYTQAIPSNPSHASSSAGDLLAALCRHVLDTQQAQLIPLGSVASLAGPPLCYPATSTAPPLRPPPDLAQGMTLLDPMQFAPYGWAIPVWSERGLIGVLLIGKKEDGGLYTQEEMEIAQTTAERILQLLASEQMVRHLMELQRRRTTEQRVMDLRTRRTLHDEILPALHLAVLQLSGADRQQPTIQNTLATLADAHRRIAVLLTDAQPAPARDPDPCELLESGEN